MRRAASRTSMLKQTGHESTKTGLAPTRATQPAVAKKVKLGQRHFVARADAERHQREENRVGAGTDAEGIFGPGELGERALEPLDFRAQNKVPRAQHAKESLPQFRLQRGVLRLQVEQVHVHRAIMREGRVAEKALLLPRPFLEARTPG